MLYVEEAPARLAATVPSMSAGFGKTILQDFEISSPSHLSIYPNNPSPATQEGRELYKMRYGWTRRGYLTETLIPVGAFLNRGRPMVPVWKFERPYRLDPGESLTAVISSGGVVSTTESSIVSDSTPAIMFNALRVKDRQPKLLYDVSRDVALNSTTNAPNTRSMTVTCDSDTSMLLYSVSIHDWYDVNITGNTPAETSQPSNLQIFGPGGREWFHGESLMTGAQSTIVGYTPGQFNRYSWVDLQGDYVELGEQNGWVLEPGEDFILELERLATGATAKELALTLRGCMEVLDD
jgi:hypothetical protein